MFMSAPGLWARLTRALFYDLADARRDPRRSTAWRCSASPRGVLFFAMAPADEIGALRDHDRRRRCSAQRIRACAISCDVRSRDCCPPRRPAPAIGDDARPAMAIMLSRPSLDGRFPAAPAQARRGADRHRRPSGRPTVLLTQRSGALRNHSGQIAFPGGRIDPRRRRPARRRAARGGGGNRPAAGLVSRSAIGDLYLTSSGYRIVPVVGSDRTPTSRCSSTRTRSTPSSNARSLS